MINALMIVSRATQPPLSELLIALFTDHTALDASHKIKYSTSLGSGFVG